MNICKIFNFYIQQGDACMILPTISEQEALEKFPKGFSIVDVPSGKKYLRQTAQP